MRRDGAKRLALAVVLVLALVGLAAHYDATRLANTESLTTVEAVVGPDPPGVGDRAYLWLTVESVADSRLTVSSPAGVPPLVVDASGIETGTVARVAPGDVVQVFGVVTGDARIEATRLVVHDRGNQRRMYVISAIGGLLAAGAFLRRWRVDWRRLTFTSRGDGPVDRDPGASDGGGDGG